MPATRERLAGAVLLVHVVARRAGLRAVRGVHVHDLDSVLFVEIGALLFDDAAPGVGHQPVHAPQEAWIPEVELLDDDPSGSLDSHEPVEDPVDLGP